MTIYFYLYLFFLIVVASLAITSAMSIDADTAKGNKLVVGLWHRFVSDLVDAMFLRFIGLLASFPLNNFFYSLGERG